jgi:hypothetical protein
MNAESEILRDLDLQIQAMARTESPSELFKALRAAGSLTSPRGAVFLVRQGRIKGWSAFGYDHEAMEANRRFDCGLCEGWLGALASTPDLTAQFRPSGATGPDFGQAPSSEAVGCAVRIQGRAVALIVCERNPNESPWHPETLKTLSTVAQLRLELDLSLRRLQAETPATTTRPSPEPRAATVQTPTQAPPAAEPAVTPPSDLEMETGLAPAPEDPAQGQPEIEAARRFARLVATDIRLYNEEAVVLGRRNGDLEVRLEEPLGRGRETFLRRHEDLGEAGLDLLREAYVQVLAAGDEALIPESVVHEPVA